LTASTFANQAAAGMNKRGKTFLHNLDAAYECGPFVPDQPNLQVTYDTSRSLQPSQSEKRWLTGTALIKLMASTPGI
jgi:hypothetical protein